MKKPFKKFAYTSIALAGLLASPALAATSSFTQSAYRNNWTGPYAGIHGGGAWSDFEQDSGTAGTSGSAGNFIAGLQGGYNMQRQRFVYGVEGDFSAISNQSRNSTATVHEDWMMTLRGRAGYAINNFLPYVTVGLGLTNVISKAPGQGDDERLQPGVAAGAGIDSFITGNWVGRLEYLFVDVPTESTTLGTTTVSSGSSNHIFRLGFNYKF